MKNIIILISFLIFLGCSIIPSFTSHGIVNFRVVDSTNTIYRGGQPDSKGFEYLKSIGISNIVKLNLENNKDKDASNLGLHVIYVPITIEEQLFKVSKLKIEKAASNITPGTYVH